MKNILRNKSSWLAFSASVSKNCNLIKIYAERKKRYLGNSKLSFYGLVKHSLRVNAVFFKRVSTMSLLYIFILINFVQIKIIFVYIFISLISLYNFTILLILISNKPGDFRYSNKFVSKKIVL